MSARRGPVRAWLGAWAVVNAAVVAVACSGGTPGTPAAPATGGVDAGAPGSSASPTYYADVKAIVDAKCTLCHYTGGIAPFPLLSYADVSSHKDQIGPAVSSRTMPPWPPADTCTQYQGDRSLAQGDIDTITKWVAAGAQEGDPSTYKPPSGPGPTKLTRVDDELAMPVTYTPQQRPDDYRCFLIPWAETATKYITGFGAKPGQPSIVHHLLVYEVPAAQVPTYQAYDDADPGPGYTCFGGPMGNLNANGTATPGADAGAVSATSLPHQIGGWVPGSLGADFPASTGIRIDPGSMVVLQVHYNTLTADPVPDQTKLDFELESSVAKEALILPFTDVKWVTQKTMNIPAGDPAAQHSYEIGTNLWASYASNGGINGNAPFTIYNSALHMHLHGTHTTIGLDRVDGSSTCLLDIPHWNFHWQGSYTLAQPVTVNPGDQVKISCEWDNTAANQPVINGQPMAVTDLNWGEGTTDEMCIGFVYVTQ